METYKNANQLGLQLYYTFLTTMAVRGIHALSGSGYMIPEIISEGVDFAMRESRIPQNSFSILPSQIENIELMFTNIKKIADQIADDAEERNVREMHEWSWPQAKRKLCPLFPFLSEPCE